jgi:hypothetical protein
METKLENGWLVIPFENITPRELLMFTECQVDGDNRVVAVPWDRLVRA